MDEFSNDLMCVCSGNENKFILIVSDITIVLSKSIYVKKTTLLSSQLLDTLISSKCTISMDDAYVKAFRVTFDKRWGMKGA